MHPWHVLRRSVLSHPALCVLLLAPCLVIVPPVPIDETRYLGIAWEMRQTGDWIHLHLNGAPYFDKPPLLFWAINLSWNVLGVSLWAARLVILLAAAASVELCGRIERTFAPGQAPRSPWLLMGTFAFALFAMVAMVDVMLCCCVLLGFLGMVRYVRDGGIGPLIMVLAASGLGMLAKGPVLLLHFAGPMLLIRWWAAAPLARPARTSIILISTVLLGGIPVLLWARFSLLPFGPDVGRAILLKEAAGRVVDSFAHRRPLWWYIPLLPLLLLPWPLLLRWRQLFSGQRQWVEDPVVRFGLAATVPALVGFSLISGKQIHYLLPLLPGAALLLSALLGYRPECLAIRRLIALAALLGALMLWSLARSIWHAGAGISGNGMLYLASAAFALLAAMLGRVARPRDGPWFAAAGALLLVVGSLPLLRLDVVGKLDVRALGQEVATLRHEGVAIARVPEEPGLVTFPARLREPLPTTADAASWARHHPEGYVLAYGDHGQPPHGLKDGVTLSNGWVGLIPSRTINNHSASNR